MTMYVPISHREVKFFAETYTQPTDTKKQFSLVGNLVLTINLAINYFIISN